MFVVLLQLELTGVIVHMVAGSKWSSFCITLGIHLVTISSNKSFSFLFGQEIRIHKRDSCWQRPRTEVVFVSPNCVGLVLTLSCFLILCIFILSWNKEFLDLPYGNLFFESIKDTTLVQLWGHSFTRSFRIDIWHQWRFQTLISSLFCGLTKQI